MQYLPVFFAVFQIFFLSALVVYYIFQTLLRIAQQAYITRAFYGHDESLGRQAQRAGEAAREEAKKNGDGGGILGRGSSKSAASTSTPSISDAKKPDAKNDATPATSKDVTSKRVTPPKNRPTPSPNAKGRPTPSRQQAEAERAKTAKAAKSSRPKPTKKST